MIKKGASEQEWEQYCKAKRKRPKPHKTQQTESDITSRHQDTPAKDIIHTHRSLGLSLLWTPPESEEPPPTNQRIALESTNTLVRLTARKVASVQQRPPHTHNCEDWQNQKRQSSIRNQESTVTQNHPVPDFSRLSLGAKVRILKPDKVPDYIIDGSHYLPNRDNWRSRRIHTSCVPRSQLGIFKFPTRNP